jgi:hypothetical protein
MESEINLFTKAPKISPGLLPAKFGETLLRRAFPASFSNPLKEHRLAIFPAHIWNTMGEETSGPFAHFLEVIMQAIEAELIHCVL